MGKQSVKQPQKQVSRRGVIAALAAAAVGSVAAPQVAKADDVEVTKKQAAYFSFEVARYKHDTSRYERVTNKVTTISEDVTESQYPSAKSIYNFLEKYVGYTQTVADKGKTLFTGSGLDEDAGGDGHKKGEVYLRDYVVDPYDKNDEYSGIKSDSNNPVSGKAVYEEIHQVQSMFELDDIPTSHEDDKGAKYVCKSGGMYTVYQVTTDAPTDMGDYIMGRTYSYTGTDIEKDATSPKKALNWGVKRVDDVYVAINKDEAGAFFAANSNYIFKRPTCIWHS